MIQPKNHPGGRLLKPNSTLFSLLLRTFDLLLIIGSLYLCSVVLKHWVHPKYQWNESYGLVAASAGVLFLLLGEYNRLYRAWRISTFMQEANRIVVTLAGVTFLILVIGYATKSSFSFSRVLFTCWGALATCLLLSWRGLLRYSLRRLRRQGKNTRRAAIAGSGERAKRLAADLEAAPWMGLTLKGIYDDPERDQPTSEQAPEISGDLADLIELAKERRLELVFICYPLKEEERIRDLIADLANTSTQVHVVPGLFLSGLLNAQWQDLGGFQTIDVFSHNMRGVDGMAKRLFDLVGSTLLLLLLWLPMGVIAGLIRLQSPGPALFRQRRYGLDGKEIRMFKFRTMTAIESNPTVQATKDDPRITRLGRFLRNYSLDELPQLLNVWMGDMSLVGPRPHAVLHDEQYRKLIDGYILRQRVRPGMTGLAQINGWRGETEVLEKMEKRIEHDLLYIRNWSQTLDIKILLLTLIKGFHGENAR